MNNQNSLVDVQIGDLVQCFDNRGISPKFFLWSHRKYEVVEIDGAYLRVKSVGGDKNDDGLFHDARRFERVNPITANARAGAPIADLNEMAGAA